MSIVSLSRKSPAALLARTVAFARMIRARLRLISALILLSFVVCHLTSHMSLLVSVPLANEALGWLMAPWWSRTGTAVLAAALLVHYLNALWSIYVRRHLRLPRWEWAQLALGLAIPLLLTLHVASTKIADEFLGSSNDYTSVLVRHWVVAPWTAWLQVAALLTVWTHASIGIHFWLRTKKWYPDWRPIIGAFALLIPALAIAGYISGGNQVLREAARPGFVEAALANARITSALAADTVRLAALGLSLHVGLVLLAFAGRAVRALAYRLRRPPTLVHSSGQRMRILPGATVLETLRASGIPHASVCGGRARCTTCRIRVVDGQDSLPPPAGLEPQPVRRHHHHAAAGG